MGTSCCRDLHVIKVQQRYGEGEHESESIDAQQGDREDAFVTGSEHGVRPRRTQGWGEHGPNPRQIEHESRHVKSKDVHCHIANEEAYELMHFKPKSKAEAIVPEDVESFDPMVYGMMLIRDMRRLQHQVPPTQK